MLEHIVASAANVILVALGLGLVIFVHELGHFLVARWAGIRVERFSIGFGRPLWTWRRGETEYALGPLPLGGYVRMTGEDPHEGVSTDPRAFSNQPVGKRMAVICAGVAMNLAFGFALFSVVLRLGIEFTSVRDGVRVQPGSPAWEAGIQPGDSVLQINDLQAPDFNELKTEVALSRPGHDRLKLIVRRRGVEAPITAFVYSRPGPDTPTIGIGTITSLEFDGVSAFSYGYPASRAEFGRPGRVVAVSGVPVHTLFEYEEQLYQALYRRRAPGVRLDIEREDGTRLSVWVPASGQPSIGLRTHLEPVAAVQPDSPADRAGLQAGDLLTAVEGQRPFDPYDLAFLASERAAEGQPLRLTVRRGAGSEAHEIDVVVRPRRVENWGRTLWVASPYDSETPFEVNALGLALHTNTTVASVTADGPAARAGLTPGATLVGIRFLADEPDGADPGSAPGEPLPLVRLKHGQALEGWIRLMPRGFAFQVDYRPAGGAEGGPVKTVTLVTEPDPIRPTLELGLPFRLQMHLQRSTNFWEPIVFGWQKTTGVIKRVYLTVRSMAAGNVSTRNLAGPIRIGTFAYKAASKGGLSYLCFVLAVLSVNLAVINFFPIPILDGGHMIFLLIERLKGSPVSLRIQTVANVVGLTLILSLFVYVTLNDITALRGG